MKNHKPSRKPLLHSPLRIVVGILVVVILASFVLELTNTTNFIKSGDTTATKPTGPTAEEKRKEAESNAEIKKKTVEEQTTTPPTQPPQSKNIDLSARQESNGTVTVFTKLTGYSSGTCELTATNGDKTSTQSATIIYQREFSSCAGFSVPKSNLGSGLWTLKLTATSAGMSESQTISYEVK